MNVHFSFQTDNWATPQDFFNELNKEFNFTLDPCADEGNAKCPRFYTKSDDGLTKSWDKEIVFCNPPYGREIGKWVKKASEATGGGSSNVNSSKDRHEILSPIYLSQSRDKILER